MPVEAARSLLNRFQLVLPISVQEFAQIHAHIEFIPLKRVNAVLIKEHGNLMFINSKFPKTSQRFFMAHLLGHIYCEHPGKVFICNSPWTAQGKEYEAWRFAVELLIPQPHFENMYKSGMTTEELARRFLVSERTIKWRIADLGLDRKFFSPSV